MKKRRFICFLCFLCFLCILPVSAETDRQYATLYPFDEAGYARAMSQNSWGILNRSGDRVVPFRYGYIGESQDGYRLIKKGELYGFLGEDLQETIKPVYALAQSFQEGYAPVRNEAGLWGFIDTEGALIVPYMYEDVSPFSGGLALVKSGGLYGYIDGQNTVVIPFIYKEAYSFFENRACVKGENGYGYIDKTGQVAIDCVFDLAFDFCGGGAVVKQGGYGLIDSKGAFLIEPTWKHLSPCLSQGVLQAFDGTGYRLISSDGTPLTKERYTEIGQFSGGFWPVKGEKGYGYIDASYTLVIPQQWDVAGPFSQGYAPVMKDGKWGYINEEGTVVCQPTYNECGRFSEGFGLVLDGETGWQFIDEETLFTQAEKAETPAETTPSEEPTGPSQTAPPKENTLVLQIGNLTMKQRKEEILLDAAPILHEGNTMLPIRHVVEAIGGRVTWNGTLQQITVARDSHVVVMHLNQKSAISDGVVTLLPAAPMLQNERTLVPFRFAMESIGCKVTWVGESQEIIIEY